MDEQGKPVQPSTEESPKIPKKPRRTAASNDETDDVQQSEPTQPRHNKGSLKRAHSEEDTPLAKKAKLTTEDDEDIVLVQDNVGAIVIEDD